MKILLVHNNYGKYSGEEAVVDKMASMLKGLGHEVAQLRMSTEGLRDSALGKIKGFVAGIHSPAGVRAMREALKREKPDVVNVHNLYPLHLAGCAARVQARGSARRHDGTQFPADLPYGAVHAQWGPVRVLPAKRQRVGLRQVQLRKLVAEVGGLCCAQRGGTSEAPLHRLRRHIRMHHGFSAQKTDRGRIRPEKDGFNTQFGGCLR